MNFKMITFIFSAFFSAALMSCQDSDKKGAEEVEIMSVDEKTDSITVEDTLLGLNDLPADSPLGRFQADPELSSFDRNVRSSGIAQELEGKEGPFTFFAPSNAAYDRLPAEQREKITDPRNSSTNRELMKYYMVDGEMTVDWIRQKIESSENKSYTIRTMNGKELTARLEGDKVILTDPSGNKAVVEKSEMDERFGVYHTIDNVLWPGKNSSGEVLTN